LSNEIAGENFTPRSVTRLIANLLFNPEEDIDRPCADGATPSLHDPGVEPGGTLLMPAQHVDELNGAHA